METRTMNQVLEATILNVATSRVSRKSSIQTVLNGLKDLRTGVKLEGTTLIVDLYMGITAEPDFLNKLQDVINQHETVYEKAKTGQKTLSVDLLRPRI
jgi:hypothetical protein